MLKPICVTCQRFYKPERNGVGVVEGMPIHHEAPAGTLAPEMWQPYKLWAADKWKCHGCGHMLIVGSGQTPVSEHYLPNFSVMCEKFKAAIHRVNDC